jgi:diphthamide synthase (EF-2-diphthine--ammonia ligase)
MILPTDMDELARMWLLAKQMERDAVEERREIEDHIKKLARISEQLDTTENVGADGFEIKVEGRIDRKVDSEKLQMLATEAGLTDHLSTLFRWKPEINMSAWKNADETITALLAGAITAKPGRPSFKITPKE